MYFKGSHNGEARRDLRMVSRLLAAVTQSIDHECKGW
jgi:hypothetical protein